ncbi:MAG: fused MFS/spermidine synthase [bacterium]
MKTKTNKNSSILIFLFISGACGLIYEILWMKMLTLVMGNTVFSITTVLASFMGGLALGSFLAGVFEEKITHPLRTFGLLEGGIGAYALLLPTLIAGTEPLFRIVYHHGNLSFHTLGLLRFLICGLILLIPTTLMGATLPVLGKYLIKNQERLGWGLGLLYGVNTLGAVVGSFAAGFYLIPLLGVSRLLYSASFLNFVICASILTLFPDSAMELAAGDEKNISSPQSKRTGIAIAVMIGIGLSGSAAMTYQIAWTRTISLSIGSTVYAFSMILTCFISGLALGSISMGRLIDRGKDSILWLALIEGIIGISALCIVPLLGKLPIFVGHAVFDAFHSFHTIHVAEFGIIFFLIIIPALMMGAAIPVATKICTRDVTRVGRSFGIIYAVDTGGAIIGAFIAGFYLIPWIGAQKSIFIAASLNMIAAIIILLHDQAISLLRRIGAALVIAVIALVLWGTIRPWDAFVLASAPYIYADQYKGTSAEKGIDLEKAMKKGRELLYFKEGLHALVAVEKTLHDDITLEINGKTDASAKGGDTITQLMLGHLPLLLSSKADDVLVIGLGSGMTLGAVTRHPVKAIDVVEIESAVVEASEYFREFNADALNDPRVNLIINDGRNHCALTSRQYDVIISEPSNPWVSGMAHLFTREFFDLAKDRLRPGGIMCQWMHAYSMSSIDFKMVVHTFHAVFPHAMVWESTLGNDYLLIGSVHEFSIDYEMLAHRMKDERLGADFERMNIHGLASFMSRLIIAEETIACYTEGVPIYTDDNALLEYSAPKNCIKGRDLELFEKLYRFRSTPSDILKVFTSAETNPQIKNDLFDIFTAKEEVIRGYAYFARGMAREARQSFEDALAIYPKDYYATYLLAKLNYQIGDAFKERGNHAKAVKAFEECIEAIERFIGNEQALLQEHFELEVMYAKANLDLGAIALTQNRLDRAAEAFLKSIACEAGHEQYSQARNNLGIVYERAGKYTQAVDQYHLAIKADPKLVSAHMNMGNTYLKQKKYTDAIESYRTVQKLRPNFALTHYNLGVAYFKQNQWAEAENEWMRALALKPDFKEAEKRLASVRAKKAL